MAKTLVGSPLYIAPELLQDDPYGPAADIWSIGVLLFQTATLSPPFTASNHGALFLKIMTAPLPHLPVHYSRGLDAVITSMLQRDPTQRPTAHDLLALPAVQSAAAALHMPLPVPPGPTAQPGQGRHSRSAPALSAPASTAAPSSADAPVSDVPPLFDLRVEGTGAGLQPSARGTPASHKRSASQPASQGSHPDSARARSRGTTSRKPPITLAPDASTAVKHHSGRAARHGTSNSPLAVKGAKVHARRVERTSTRSYKLPAFARAAAKEATAGRHAQHARRKSVQSGATAKQPGRSQARLAGEAPAATSNSRSSLSPSQPSSGSARATLGSPVARALHFSGEDMESHASRAARAALESRPSRSQATPPASQQAWATPSASPGKTATLTLLRAAAALPPGRVDTLLPRPSTGVPAAAGAASAASAGSAPGSASNGNSSSNVLQAARYWPSPGRTTHHADDDDDGDDAGLAPSRLEKAADEDYSPQRTFSSNSLESVSSDEPDDDDDDELVYRRGRGMDGGQVQLHSSPAALLQALASTYSSAGPSDVYDDELEGFAEEHAAELFGEEFLHAWDAAKSSLAHEAV